MNGPSAAELLTVWERGAAQSWPTRALMMLAAAHPETDSDWLARRPIGERDAHLLSVREALFGPRIDCIAECPGCGEWLEATFTTDKVRVAPDPELSAGETVHRLRIEGYDVSFRLPNSHDLVALGSCHEMAEAERKLLAGCVLEAKDEAGPIAADDLPGAVVTAVTERMAEADPQAAVQFEVECPACAHHWQATFDVVTYLWAELDEWARRILTEVHLLARAYGWREGDILTMGAGRRRAYLELLGA